MAGKREVVSRTNGAGSTSEICALILCSFVHEYELPHFVFKDDTSTSPFQLLSIYIVLSRLRAVGAPRLRSTYGSISQHLL